MWSAAATDPMLIAIQSGAPRQTSHHAVAPIEPATMAKPVTNRGNCRIPGGAGHHELRREEITHLRRKWRHLWSGIQVEHSRPHLPQDLFFMARYPPGLVRDLTRLGYPVV